MKKLFTTSLLLFSIISIWAQSSSQYKLNRRVSLNPYRTTTSETKQRLDSTVNKYDKQVFSYDNNENLLKIDIFKRTDIGFTWKLVDRVDYAYNIQNQLIRETHYALNNTTNEIYIIDKYEYSYEVNGNLVSYIYSKLVSNIYKYYYKEENTYDNNNYLISTNKYYYNTTKSDWDYNSKFTYTNDVNGNPITILGENWNAQTNQLITSYKEEITYNINNQPTLDETYNWDLDYLEWIADTQTEYIYDLNHNLITETYSVNYSTPTAWELKSKDEFTYDLNYDLSKIIGPVQLFNPSMREYMIKDEIISYYLNNKWVADPKIIYYYSNALVTSINEQTLNSIVTIYPNPTSEYITIAKEKRTTIQNITITDSNGHIVLNQSNLTDNTIPIKHLNKGFYIYQIKDNHQIQTGKLIIE